MRGLILALLIVAVCLAGDLPTLTDTRKLEVKDLQIAVLNAKNTELAVRQQCATGVKELGEKVVAAQAMLNIKVDSLRPEECPECQLNAKLVWERPKVANGGKDQAVQ